jgi:hypothetical protein
MKPSFDGVVESTQGAEARGIGDLRHREMCVHDQLPGDIEPRVVVKPLGRLSKRLFKQPSQVAGRHAESIGECFFALSFKRALCHEFERPFDGGALAVPRGRSRSGLGTAP